MILSLSSIPMHAIFHVSRKHHFLRHEQSARSLVSFVNDKFPILRKLFAFFAFFVHFGNVGFNGYLHQDVYIYNK